MNKVHEKFAARAVGGKPHGTNATANQVSPIMDGEALVGLRVAKSTGDIELREGQRVRLVGGEETVIVGFTSRAANLAGSNMRSKSKVIYAVSVQGLRDPVSPTTLTLVEKK